MKSIEVWFSMDAIGFNDVTKIYLFRSFEYVTFK